MPEKENISQRDYRPTPFANARWEVVGERLSSLDFFPMELDVMRTAAADVDPMFEDFTPAGSSSRPVYGSRVPVEPKAADSTVPEIDWEQRILDALEAGRESGRKDALEATKAEVARSTRENSQKLDAALSEIRERYAQFEADLERKAVELALRVARKILPTTAELKPEYIYDVIRAALEAAGAGKVVRMRVSPADWEFLKVIGLPEDLAQEDLGMVFVADDSIANGVVLETNFGEADLRLDSMWEQIRSSLFEGAE